MWVIIETVDLQEIQSFGLILADVNDVLDHVSLQLFKHTIRHMQSA